MRDWNFLKRGYESVVLIARTPQILTTQASDILPCSEDSSLYINNGKENGQYAQNRRKYLYKNGSIVEGKSINIVCSKDGHPCKEISAGTEIIQIPCQNISFIIPVNVYDLRNETFPLHMNTIRLSNGNSNRFCCKNSSHLLKLFGDQCESLLLTSQYIQKCYFSQAYREGTCDFENNMQTFSQFCKMKECVIKQTFKTECDKEDKIVKRCNLNKFLCGINF